MDFLTQNGISDKLADPKTTAPAQAFDFSAEMNSWLNQLLKFIQTQLQQSFLGEYINPFILTLILIVLFISLTYAFSIIFRLFFLRYALNFLRKKAKSEKDRALINRISNLVFPLFTLIGLRMSTASIEAYYQKKILFLSSPLDAILIFLFTIFIKRLLVVFLKCLGQRDIS